MSIGGSIICLYKGRRWQDCDLHECSCRYHMYSYPRTLTNIFEINAETKGRSDLILEISRN